MAYELSVGHVWKRDWPSFGLSVFLGLVWLFVLAVYLTNAFWHPQDGEGWATAHIFGTAALVITVVCGAVIGRRIYIIRHVFACGALVQGKVLEVGENSEDIGNALIAYHYQGRDYSVRKVTEGAHDRGGIVQDELVDIMVDPKEPSRAFIVKVFLDSLKDI